MLETDVDSFIVRFVQVRSASLRPAPAQQAQEKSQNSGPAAVPWHGVIRHVQSKEEIRFTQIEEALRFVANFVQLAPEDPPPDDCE